MSDRRTPFWLWPNLLSLDAPIVAVVWLHMFRRAWGLGFFPPAAYLALGLSVWAIYVVDRLLDLKLRPVGDPALGLRHAFHGRHWKLFVGGVLASLAVVVFIALAEMPVELIQTYSIPAIGLLVGFFSLVLASTSEEGIPYVRNIIAGLAFGFGTASIAHVYVPGEGVGNLLFSREMLSFAVLCVLNISAIHLWEHSRQTEDPELKAMDELALTLPLLLLAGFAVAFAYSDNRGMFGGGIEGADYQVRPFFYAVLISAALLYVLNRLRDRFSLVQLRCLADLVMIVPLPLFIVLSGS